MPRRDNNLFFAELTEEDEEEGEGEEGEAGKSLVENSAVATPDRGALHKEEYSSPQTLTKPAPTRAAPESRLDEPALELHLELLFEERFGSTGSTSASEQGGLAGASQRCSSSCTSIDRSLESHNSSQSLDSWAAGEP